MRLFLLVCVIALVGLSTAKVTKKFYFNTVFQENWYKSYHLCKISGTRLATITSQAEMDELIQAIRDANFVNEHWWIGGTNLGNEPNFYWMDQVKPMTYTNWNTDRGEPNNAGGKENCIQQQSVSYSAKWNDIECSYKNYFICEEEVETN